MAGTREAYPLQRVEGFQLRKRPGGQSGRRQRKCKLIRNKKESGRLLLLSLSRAEIFVLSVQSRYSQECKLWSPSLMQFSGSISKYSASATTQQSSQSSMRLSVPSSQQKSRWQLAQRQSAPQCFRCCPLHRDRFGYLRILIDQLLLCSCGFVRWRLATLRGKRVGCPVQSRWSAEGRYIFLYRWGP